MIEALKVKLLRGESVVQLGELAQVMPRGGRTVVVVVGEKEVRFCLINYFLSLVGMLRGDIANGAF